MRLSHLFIVALCSLLGTSALATTDSDTNAKPMKKEHVNRPAQAQLRFTPKEVQFLIESVGFKIKNDEAVLSDPATDDDTRSDLTNDLGLLRETLKYLQQEHKYSIRHHENDDEDDED